MQDSDIHEMLTDNTTLAWDVSLCVCWAYEVAQEEEAEGGGGGALAGRLFPSKVTRKRGKSGVTRILLTLIF